MKELAILGRHPTGVSFSASAWKRELVDRSGSMARKKKGKEKTLTAGSVACRVASEGAAHLRQGRRYEGGRTSFSRRRVGHRRAGRRCLRGHRTARRHQLELVIAAAGLSIRLLSFSTFRSCRKDVDERFVRRRRRIALLAAGHAQVLLLLLSVPCYLFILIFSFNGSFEMPRFRAKYRP